MRVARDGGGDGGAAAGVGFGALGVGLGSLDVVLSLDEDVVGSEGVSLGVDVGLGSVVVVGDVLAAVVGVGAVAVAVVDGVSLDWGFEDSAGGEGAVAVAVEVVVGAAANVAVDAFLDNVEDILDVVGALFRQWQESEERRAEEEEEEGEKKRIRG